MTAGYSKRSLVDKLGIKPGQRIYFENAPDDYATALGQLPPEVTLLSALEEPVDFIQFFTMSRAELEMGFERLQVALKKNGMLWISWPKKASKILTDVTEDVAREIGLENGMVDVKVCAVDDIWSGLKFVYRLKDRA